jgi:hypothetical protein
MSAEQRGAPPPILAQHSLLLPVPGVQQAAVPRVDTLTGLGGSALTRAVERWQRALLHDRVEPSSAGPPREPTSAGPASVGATPDAEALAALTRRLDDSGCSYGRVTAARLDGVIRASDRMETKLNAVLMAVTGTFLSTLAGLLLYYVRGGGQ